MSNGLMGKLKTNLVLQLGLLTIASIVWFVAWLVIGHKGECRPHDRDCQNGLSSMVGLLYGFGGAFVIFVGGGISALIAYVKRNGK